MIPHILMSGLALAALTATPAKAAFVDFTDAALFPEGAGLVSAFATIAGVGITVTGSPASQLTFPVVFEKPDTDACTGGFGGSPGFA
jgi:hypothetical protein